MAQSRDVIYTWFYRSVGLAIQVRGAKEESVDLLPGCATSDLELEVFK
jgi:hypothetical protein